MADYGVTSTGFVIKTQEEILESLEEKVRSQISQDIDVNPDQPLGQILGIMSQAIANGWEMGNGCYRAFDPDNAFGNGLSDLVQLNQIERLPATYSTVLLTLTGTTGTTVPKGSICASADNQLKVTTLESVVINTTGIPVQAQLTVAGNISIPANSITQIKTPIFGWDTVDNVDKGDTGREEETDVQLRSRRQASVALASSSNIDGLYGALQVVPNIKYIRIYENDTSVVDPITQTPPRSFQCVVDGGLDEDVAKAIFTKKPVGIGTYGNLSESVNDIAGFPRTISFTRPVPTDVFVKVSVKAATKAPASLADDIKQAIVNFSQGFLIEGEGYGVSESVPVSQLFTPVNSIKGVSYIEGLSAGLSLASLQPSGLIPINFNEVASFIESNIEVTLV